MSVKSQILGEVRRIALGNTTTKLKHVASDMLNALGTDKKAVERAANGTYLHQTTIKNVMLCDEDYRPHSETLERVLRYCGAQVTISEVQIQEKYQNQPKVDEEYLERKKLEQFEREQQAQQSTSKKASVHASTPASLTMQRLRNKRRASRRK